MIIAVSFCAKDVGQFIRLAGWLNELKQLNGSISNHRLLMLVDGVKPKEISLAVKVAQGWTRDIRVEPVNPAMGGWPMGPNAMFQAALDKIARIDDMLWLEPDSIPLTPDWLDQILAEWGKRKSHQHFMGNLVEYYINHMTGIGVYGRNWQTHAPKLAEAWEYAWDVYAADQILPRLKVTPLVQHVFHNPEIDDLSILDPRAVIFHQDKAGRLIELLAKKYFPRCNHESSRQ